MSKDLLPNDVLVRYDADAKTVSFLIVDKGKTGLSVRQMHEVEWDPSKGVNCITDIGVGVSAFLHASFLDKFCSVEQWEKLAREVRIAAGRDEPE